MKVIFRMPHEEVTEPVMPVVSALVVGHTVEIKDVVYEIIGVRLVLSEKTIIVTLDDTGGRSTMPPPKD